MFSGRTALTIFAIAWVVSLTGDACHVASGTTRYLVPWMPHIWRSAFWFPFVVGAGILILALQGLVLGLPYRTRTRVDAVTAIAAVLGLYALTAAMRGQPIEVAVVLITASSIALWAWWDPSTGSLVSGLMAATVGPLVEIILAKLHVFAYADDVSQLWGVAPWLPSLYFAAGAVASGLWRALQRS
jgi:hypothetical protein